MEEEYLNSSTTTADYQNIKNVYLKYFEDFAHAVMELRVCNKLEYRIQLKYVIKRYYQLYIHLNDEEKMGHLTKEERIFMRKVYENKIIMTKTIAIKLLDLARKIMDKYGLLQLGNTDTEAW